MVEAAVPCERVIREGEEAHRAVLTAEREQGECRVGGDAPDGAALQRDGVLRQVSGGRAYEDRATHEVPFEDFAATTGAEEAQGCSW